MNELLDKITEFCSDNLEMIAGAGGILLVLILLGIFISNKIKDRPADERREFFLEGEYDTMIREEAHAKKAAVHIQAEPEQEYEAEALPEIEPAAEESPLENLELEDLMEEDEAKPVHININIERGQVKIGYDEDGRITCMVESDQEEVPAQKPAAEPEGGREEMLPRQDGIVLEKINLIKAAPVKKFGPDNFNTGRSGRVFTEDELQQQIKD